MPADASPPRHWPTWAAVAMTLGIVGAAVLTDDHGMWWKVGLVLCLNGAFVGWSRWMRP